jgi:tetratricopeptide (TPR) repeat protein
LKQTLEENVRKLKSDAGPAPDEETIRRLQSLGYVTGPVSEDFTFDQSKDDPKDLVDFHNIYASVGDLVLKKEYEQAENLCHKLALQRPQVYQIYVFMAYMAREQGYLDRAVSHLNRAIEVRPDVAKLQQYLGTILTKQEKFDQAIAHFNKSLQINPSQFLVHHELAAVFYKQKKFDQAITHLTEALRLKRDSVKTISRLGDVHAENGNFSEATKYFQQAVNMDPFDVKNHSLLVKALAIQKRYDEATKQLHKGIRLMRDNGQKDDAVTLERLLELVESQKLKVKK